MDRQRMPGWTRYGPLILVAVCLLGPRLLLPREQALWFERLTDTVAGTLFWVIFAIVGAGAAYWWLRIRRKPEPDTVRSALEAHSQVGATCADCGNYRRLDLSDLADAGHGDTPLTRLPFRCECGSGRFKITVVRAA